MGSRGFLVVALAVVILATVGVNAASAAVPAPQPKELRRLTFEPGSPSFSSVTAFIVPGEDPPTAYWGRVNSLAKTGQWSFWCAGTAYPSGLPSSFWPTYPVLTRGTASLLLPELSEYYSSSASFAYLMPSRGADDDGSFAVFCQATDGTGNPIGSVYADPYIPLASSWTNRTYNLSSNPTAPVSRKPAILSLRFFDFIEGSSQGTATGQGAAIDDLVVSGYQFGPIRSLTAGRSGPSVLLSWSTPYGASNSSSVDTRTIAFHVWRAPESAPTAWTELTSAAGTPANTFSDSAAPGYACRYFVQAFNAAGDEWGDPSGSTASVVSLPDSTKPVTTISGIPGGWSKNSVTFSLDATDEAWNTITSSYRLNSGSWVTYATPVTVSSDGTTAVDYYSKDQANNIEGTKSATIRVDKTAPVTTASIAYAAGTTTVQLNATDANSGVATTTYTLDNGPLRSGTSIPVSGVGTHTVTFSSVDNAGNVENVHIESVAVLKFAVDRIEGGTRYDTAIAAAEKAFPTGATTVVLAFGRNFPDALGGAALCGVEGAPLLLTDTGSMPSAVRTEITHLKATHAVIIGSTGVVSSAVQADLATLVGGAAHVERIAGGDRYDTASRVATTAASISGGGKRADVFLAVGDNFPDALAASPAAYAKQWPILLTRRTDLPVQTRAALSSLQPARIHILGSTGAVPQVVEDAVKAAFPTVVVDRWMGGNRYATAVDIADKSGLSFAAVGIATGENFPDALAGGVMQGKLGSVVLLTPTAALAPDTSAALVSNKAVVTTVRYLGSTGAVSNAVRDSITQVLQ
jgi:putative cell wall-binding protein